MSDNQPVKPPETPGNREPTEFDFRDLAGAGREVVIVLDDKKYRLLITKNGKLILNR